MAYALDSLKSHHREIARLSFEGFKPAEIAERVDMSVETIRQILRDPLCQAAVERLASSADEGVIDVRKELSKMNKDALARLSDMLKPYSDVSPSVQLKAAQDVLDRNGYAAKFQHEHSHLHMTAEELSEIKSRAREAGAFAPPTEDELDEDTMDADPLLLEHPSAGS